MRQQNQIIEYKGNKITFLSGDNVMVNATEMAKLFNKRPIDWLKFQQSKEFIEALSKVRILTLADLVVVRKGGNNPGTWMHQDVAIEFARWLSPDLAIWCNDRIKEIAKYGFTATEKTLEDIITDPDLIIRMAQELKGERQKSQMLQVQNEMQHEAIKEIAPKAEYFDKVLQSKSTYITSQIAKELDMTATALNNILADLKIQYKRAGTWMLYEKYQGKGYTKTKTYTYAGSDDQPKTSMQTVWTEKGRKLIHELIQVPK